MPLSLVAPPSGQVMSLDDAKAHLRVDATDDDTLIAALIDAVTERAEVATKRALLGPQTWTLTIDGFPRADYVELPKPPLVSVPSVQYIDTQGVLQTATLNTNYKVQAPAGPRCLRGRIYLPFATVWPITILERGAVKVTFTCGYGAAADIPPLLLSAMKLDLGSLYENREGVVMGGRAAFPDVLPMGVKEIYDSFESRPTQRLEFVA